MFPKTIDHNTYQHTYTFSNNLHIPIPNIKQEQPTHTPTEHINKTIYKGYCFTERPSHPPTFPTQAAHVFDTCKCLSMFCTKTFPKGCFSFFTVLFSKVLYSNLSYTPFPKGEPLLKGLKTWLAESQKGCKSCCWVLLVPTLETYTYTSTWGMAAQTQIDTGIPKP